MALSREQTNARSRERHRTDPVLRARRSAAMLHWQATHREQHLASRRVKDKRRNRETRIKLLALYGQLCVCCGEDTFEFLAIDHTHGGSNKHIKQFRDLRCYYKWLLEEKREDFRTLCHNCNLSRGFYGYCPHEKQP